MVEEKEELLEKLRRVKQTAEKYLAEKNFDDYIVKNVIRYNKEIGLTTRDSDEKETKGFYLYVAELENTNPELDGEDILTELEFLEDENGNLYSISDLIQEYEGFESIKDVVEKTKENEEKPEEEQDEELKKDTLKELETEKEKEIEEEKKNKEQESEEDKDITLTSDTVGATSLDQQIDRKSLRNLMGLEPDDAYIKPISASEVKRKYGITINTEEGIEIIKKDGISRMAGKEIVKQDRQEGNNSFDRDLNIDVNGEVEYKSNTTSLELVNMPGRYISIGYDEGSAKKEVKFSKRSGINGHSEPEKELLKKGASEYQDPEQRNMLRRNEEGRREGDEIIARQQAIEETGIDNDRVENIDNNEKNDIDSIDPDAKIEGTDITWREFANKLRIQRKRWY